MKPSKINPFDFKDVFGVTLTEVGRSHGFTKQGFFQNLSGEWKSEKFPSVIESLTAMLEDIHKNDLQIAEYRYAKGKEILDNMKKL